MIACRTAQPEDRAAWDDFVRAHPQGSPFHLHAWRDVIESSFGYRTTYLIAADGGSIVGVLPLFIVNNFITGKIIVSTPFAVYGGVLAANDAAHAALCAEAQSLARRLDVQYLELRNHHAEQRAGFDGISRYATFTKDVAPGSEADLLQSIPQKTRNLVRKALRHPYASRRTRRLDGFYPLIAASYRRHGTPVFPRRFFAEILLHFGDEVDVREIVLGDTIVAASLNFFFREQMHTYYAASVPNALAMAPNNFMYFDHLLWAGNNGYRVFDFGRSKVDTGAFQFKKHWGTTQHPLPYEVMLVRCHELPNFSPKNPKFAMAARVWQKIPLPMTLVLGPRLVSLFP